MEKLVFKCVRASAQKMREFVRSIQSMELTNAIQLVWLWKKKRATQLRKVLLNAANILSQKKLLSPTVRIKSISVDKAQSTKMPIARAKGRVNFIEKQTCHITLAVEVQ